MLVSILSVLLSVCPTLGASFTESGWWCGYGMERGQKGSGV